MRKNQKHMLALALALSILSASAHSEEHYFMRVPAPAKCAGANCAMRPTLPDAATQPDKPKTPKGSITSSTGPDFGIVAVGMSRTMVLTITNTGTVPIPDAFVESAGAGFNVRPTQATTCGRATRKQILEPGATCQATIGFAPSALLGYTGSIYLRSASDTNSVAKYDLTGKGGLVKPVLDVTSLNFGEVSVGASAVKSVTVTNRGEVPHLIGFGQQGDSKGNTVVFAVSSPCDTLNYEIPVGGSCTFTVTATPTEAKVATYNLYLNFGPAHQAYTVPMTVSGK